MASDHSLFVQVIHVGSVHGRPVPTFDPPSVKAAKGSTVSFIFDAIPGNHTVAQSAFAKPCEPLAGGFDSGFIFVPDTTDPSSLFPTFNITIMEDTERA
ncbi:hypothetical protein TRAPUB_4640 [Trametes pubescens]|uniref:Plastocyanin-like domain-containing protein n=1 Tax=Trametes pubescens TaxID=154538 RepID=A0A1M2VAI7_TRAPU|nr:hypothetical protein TRAPUB_4640 [Trametes pubescens]